MSALRNRDFRLLFAGQTVSNLGTNVVAVAMAIYITKRTGSGTDLGIILASLTLPFVLLLLFGGVWADRLPRHRVMIVTDVIRGSLHALLAVLIFTGSASILSIALIEAGFGAAWAFFQPAYTGLLPQTVGESEIREAQSLMTGSWNLSMLLGPSLGTALVLTLGAGEAFAVDAATFLVSAILLAPMHPRPRATEATADAEPTSTFHELREGFGEVRSRPWVWATILAYTVVLLCYFATWSSLAPLVTKEVYGTVAMFGVLAAVSGAGSVLGSIVGTLWQPRHPLRIALGFGVLWPASAVVLALGAPRAVMIGWVFIAGINSALFIVAWETSLAQNIPPQALSRVSSYDWMGSLGLLPLGFAIAGPLADQFGARNVLGVGGAIGTIAVTLALIPHSTRALTAQSRHEPLPLRVTSSAQ